MLTEGRLDIREGEGSPSSSSGGFSPGAASIDDATSASRLLTTSLVVFVRDEPGALLAMTQAVTDNSYSIVDVSSQVATGREIERQSSEVVGAFQFRVHLTSMAQLDNLVMALSSLSQVVSVRRDSMELMLEDCEERSGTSSFWQYARGA